VAEDLGVITPAVERLRDDNGLPGMKVLQFAFAADGADPTCPTTTAPTRSSTPAPTTTTRG
jgi:4-alpha-glucanotransferase